jgi:TPR repeat protein
MTKKKEMDKLLAKAQAGDAYSMYSLGHDYEYGSNGFEQDYKLAFHWYKKGHEAGDLTATALVGRWIIDGRHGVAKNRSEGLLLTALAAERGSDWAAYHLGLYYSRGKHDLPVNTTQAIWWFQKCLSAPHKQLSDSCITSVSTKLEQLMTNREGDDSD